MNHIVARVLDQFDIDARFAKRWDGKMSHAGDRCARSSDQTTAGRNPMNDLRNLGARASPTSPACAPPIEWLRAEGLLIETDKEVNPDLEITGLQKHFDGSLPMLFNNVKGKPHARAITNLFGDIRVIEQMFGFGPTQRDRVKIAKRAQSAAPAGRSSTAGRAVLRNT